MTHVYNKIPVKVRESYKYTVSQIRVNTQVVIYTLES